MEQELAEIGSAQEIAVTAVDYSRVMVQSSGGCSFVEGYILEFERDREELVKKIDKAKGIIQRVDRALDALPERERLLVRMRYFEGEQWNKIASEVGYTDRHCKRLRHLAIEKIIIALWGI